MLQEGNNASQQPRIQQNFFDIEVLAGSMSDPEDLQFFWEVTEFTSNEMEIKLSFEKPGYVSSSQESDELVISFNAEANLWFEDENGQTFDNSFFMKKVLPMIIADENLLARIMAM